MKGLNISTLASFCLKNSAVLNSKLWKFLLQNANQKYGFVQVLFSILIPCSDGYGSIFSSSARVSLSLDLENFPYKCQIFSLWVKKKSLWVGSISTWVKGGLASYLLRLKSMLGSGQGPSLIP